MLIGRDSALCGFKATLVEPDINREASRYIVDNYNSLILFIRKQKIREEKAHDLLQDVYISVHEAESNGEGFNMFYGSKSEDGCITMDVAQFVHGRIKLYSKNNKYRTDVIDTGTCSVIRNEVEYETLLDKNGKEVVDKHGNVKKYKKTTKVKKNLPVGVYAASYNDGAEDMTNDNDCFQKAFAMASVSDSVDDVTELLSLREQIDFCIDVCDLHNINILNIFKNMDLLSSMLGDFSARKKTSDSVFSGLSRLVGYHDELAETLMSILKYSSKNRTAFEAVLDYY